MTMSKTGILLINLGTPDQPDVPSVRKYLREFLSDPRVIDLPTPARWLLLNLIILPFRPKQSSEAYQQIWTEQGSPLLINSQNLVDAVAKKLGNDYQVVLGMRYGNPSIPSALEQLKHCQQIKVLPLFPQYSSAATGSAIEKVLCTVAMQWNTPSISIINSFYDQPQFIAAYAKIIEKNLAEKKPDLLLFSYHGLPERHIKKSECQAACDLRNACPDMNNDNSYCYRAQCYATSKLLAQQLGLQEDQYITTFQSRLGRVPWIQPYTDNELPKLIKQGIKNIAVACPSFTADCLETLEEIGLRAKQQWQELGGESFTLIPCLNDDEAWVESIISLIK
jgi:ferrochelatase